VTGLAHLLGLIVTTAGAFPPDPCSSPKTTTRLWDLGGDFGSGVVLIDGTADRFGTTATLPQLSYTLDSDGRTALGLAVEWTLRGGDGSGAIGLRLSRVMWGGPIVAIRVVPEAAVNWEDGGFHGGAFAGVDLLEGLSLGVRLTRDFHNDRWLLQPLVLGARLTIRERPPSRVVATPTGTDWAARLAREVKIMTGALYADQELCRTRAMGVWEFLESDDMRAATPEALVDALRRHRLPEFAAALNDALVVNPPPPDASTLDVVRALVQGVRLGLEP
jgi:hypothetical protein